MKTQGPCLKMIKNFKIAAAEHHTKHRTLLSVGPCVTTQVTCLGGQSWSCLLPSSPFSRRESERLPKITQLASSRSMAVTLIHAATEPRDLNHNEPPTVSSSPKILPSSGVAFLSSRQCRTFIPSCTVTFHREVELEESGMSFKCENPSHTFPGSA